MMTMKMPPIKLIMKQKREAMTHKTSPVLRRTWLSCAPSISSIFGCVSCMFLSMHIKEILKPRTHLKDFRIQFSERFLCNFDTLKKLTLYILLTVSPKNSKNFLHNRIGVSFHLEQWILKSYCLQQLPDLSSNENSCSLAKLVIYLVWLYMYQMSSSYLLSRNMLMLINIHECLFCDQ